MAKSKSSNRWLDEHHADAYVKEARKQGYRSRASFKLIELNEKDRLFKPGMSVLDLGAAPGGWSQVAIQKVGMSGKVIASDILDMDTIAGVDFLQGDFTCDEVYGALLSLLNGKSVDLVISDMAPNMSGMADVDLPRSMHLVELALDMSKNVLKPGGIFVAKVFQGEGFEQFMQDCKQVFAKCVIRKPKASRPRSKEVYLVAKQFNKAR